MCLPTLIIEYPYLLARFTPDSPLAHPCDERRRPLMELRALLLAPSLRLLEEPLRLLEVAAAAAAPSRGDSSLTWSGT